jgi:hypothetical protein
MFTVIRENTANYGFVVSQHATFAAAETAVDKKAAAILRRSSSAQAYQMYHISESVPTKTKAGTRVRLASD